MATIVKPTPKESRESNLNPKIRLPRQRYSCRFTEETFEISKQKPDGSGNNPMVVLSSEIVAPDTINSPDDGSRINVAGATLKKQYLTLRVKKSDGTIDEKKSQDAFDRYSKIRELLGIPVDENEGIDVENPPKVFKGIVYDAILDSDTVVQRASPTPEQRAKGQPGDEIKGADNRSLSIYFPYVVDILGLADAEATAKGNSRPF